MSLVSNNKQGHKETVNPENAEAVAKLQENYDSAITKIEELGKQLADAEAFAEDQAEVITDAGVSLEAESARVAELNEEIINLKKKGKK